MKNYSYVTLLSSDSYIYGVILLYQSMKDTKTKYPLHVLITDDISEPIIEILRQLNISYSKTNIISMPQTLMNHNIQINKSRAYIWENCFTKFNIFNQTQFDKIIMLDCDILLLKNIDNLFDKPHLTATLDGEYFSLWKNEPHFNAGCMVIEPNNQEYLNILNFAQNLSEDKFLPCVMADQEILNLYYSNWLQQENLHLNKYYNIFAPYIQENHIEDISQNAYFIHFIGRKPWVNWVQNPNETYSEEFYHLALQTINKLAINLNMDKIIDKLVLTVYAICKNEKYNVEQWLNSFKYADYMCITDTGSTDGTWELLQEQQKKYKNLIIQQVEINPWRFDKARNKSMEIIPKGTNMFFMADLDERIKEKDWANKVKNAWSPTFNRMGYDYHRDVDQEKDIPTRTIKEYRIHSKDWSQWENVVHEALINKAGEKYFYIQDTSNADIQVWHYPNKQRNKNYIELCEEDLQYYPDDHLMRLQLAIEYEIVENWEKAQEHYLWLIDKGDKLQPFEQARCYAGAAKCYQHQNDIIKAYILFREGRIMYPTFTDNYLDAANLLYNTQQYQQSLDLCEEALRYCNEALWCNVYDINSYFAYYLGALAAVQVGQYQKALAYISIAANLNPNNEMLTLRNNFCNELRLKIKEGVIV